MRKSPNKLHPGAGKIGLDVFGFSKKIKYAQISFGTIFYHYYN